MKEEQIKKAYELAKARYAEFGIDTDKAIETLERNSYLTALLAG